jgi:NADH dehydrogenase [ubiquinone] 1 alpha subcomplex assembly factor 3
MYHLCRIPSLSTRLSSTLSLCQRFPAHPSLALPRPIHSSSILRNSSRPQPFLNILADEVPPPVQVSSISASGIQLTDGLIIPGACVLLEGKVFLWDPPRAGVWDDWKEEHFDLFQAVVPKPGEYQLLLAFCFWVLKFQTQKFCYLGRERRFSSLRRLLKTI